MVVVNLGSWDDPAKEEEYVREALEWIEYCNGDASTPMGALRAANGHPEPYNVVHWEMDNETWAMGVERYGKLVARVAGMIRARWPGLKIHACTFWEKEDGRLLELCGKQIDFISYHFYENPDRYATAPASFEALWQRYAALIAASPNPAVRLSVTEWNAQSTDWRTGLFAAGYLNVMERSAEVVKIATPALFLRRVDATDWDNAFINHDHVSWFPAPNYVVMKLFRDHFQPLRVACESPAGLNVTATRSTDDRTVVIKAVNAASSAMAADVEVAAPFVARRATAQRVAAGLNDRNTLGTPRRIAPVPVTVQMRGNRATVEFPALSVTVIEVKGR
jgi:alpha-N-arabinofuranosidase